MSADQTRMAKSALEKAVARLARAECAEPLAAAERALLFALRGVASGPYQYHARAARELLASSEAAVEALLSMLDPAANFDRAWAADVLAARAAERGADRDELCKHVPALLAAAGDAATQRPAWAVLAALAGHSAAACKEVCAARVLRDALAVPGGVQVAASAVLLCEAKRDRRSRDLAGMFEDAMDLFYVARMHVDAMKNVAEYLALTVHEEDNSLWVVNNGMCALVAAWAIPGVVRAKALECLADAIHIETHAHDRASDYHYRIAGKLLEVNALAALLELDHTCLENNELDSSMCIVCFCCHCCGFGHRAAVMDAFQAHPAFLEYLKCALVSPGDRVHTRALEVLRFVTNSDVEFDLYDCVPALARGWQEDGNLEILANLAKHYATSQACREAAWRVCIPYLFEGLAAHSAMAVGTAVAVVRCLCQQPGLQAEFRAAGLLGKAVGALATREYRELSRLVELLCEDFEDRAAAVATVLASPDAALAGKLPWLRADVAAAREARVREAWAEKKAAYAARGADFAAPDELCCPLTLNVMADPVVGSDGYTYERDAIAEVLARSQRSPFTRDVLKPDLYPNHGMRKRIREHEEAVMRAFDAEAKRARGE